MKAEAGSWRSDVGSRMSDVGNRMLEDERRTPLERRGQVTEDGLLYANSTQGERNDIKEGTFVFRLSSSFSLHPLYQFRQLAKVLKLGIGDAGQLGGADLFVGPGEAVGDVHGAGAEGQHGEHVGAERVADHQKA